MITITELIEAPVKEAFASEGLDPAYGRVGLSNRPDLCEYQCNGCLAAAKVLKTNPIELAKRIAERLKDSTEFESVGAAAPGFINLRLSPSVLSSYVKEMTMASPFGTCTGRTGKIIVDYGGANVAKPLHIGHLRSAIIGESIKRLGAYLGNTMIGDIHLGDWGLQMGLIIEELRLRSPELPYFDADFRGDWPEKAPFTIDELEKIYPAASARAKEDAGFAEKAHRATLLLQNGYEPYRALWSHIMNVSLADLKKNYDSLDVHFELWKGESDVQPEIPLIIDLLTEKGLAHESEGALVADVSEPGDKKEIPPCIIRKSDGAALYATSDLATLYVRERDYDPDAYIYITDKRQDMHFLQVFRVARKAELVKPEHSLTHIGFGTMNGPDGRPFKTRAGGVMRLEELIGDINAAVRRKVEENRELSEEEVDEAVRRIGIAAVKYGDLSNQAGKDYVFDIERFTSFEGNTGPYILYTIVRIKSILSRYYAAGGRELQAEDLLDCRSAAEKALELELVRCPEVIENAWEELAPHKICSYVYSVANAFNSFYHEVKILSQEDESVKRSYLALIDITRKILTDCIGILGMSAPDRM